LQDIYVVIVEDDPFARNWMVLLASRDWRTRVTGEADNPIQIIPILKNFSKRVDLIILDTDIPGGEDWIPRIIKTVSSLDRRPAILCTGIKPNERVLRQLNHNIFKGYILKDEIHNSLSWAISLCMSGNWVITESILDLASYTGFSLPKPCTVLEGRYAVQNLTTHQANVARLAFLFSMERRDLADELSVGEDWGYGLVSAVYEKMGIKNILSNDTDLRHYFGKHELIISHLERIKEEAEGTGKARDMETLAFHILTMPEMRELR
jgi:DNA-binding NarL/FixJ family response regulator